MVTADHDVVVVGGGPSGCSAAVFTARYGLDTVAFDRGNAALRRSAYLANYLGFPAGVDIDTFYELMHAHVAEAGAGIVPEMVVAVEQTAEGSNFAVETQEDRRITAKHVVAAAWYDGEYLRPLGGDAMFETHEHHGEVEERFDPDYPDADGRTPIDGLYVAAPNGHRNAQAIVAAGHGAHVARSLIADCREARGFPEGVAAHYDWLRPESEFEGEWGDRDRWREWFENEAGDHGLSPDRFAELRESYIDRAFDTRVPEAEIENRADRGLERLVETLGPDRVLDAIDDDRIREHLHGEDATPPDHG